MSKPVDKKTTERFDKENERCFPFIRSKYGWTGTDQEEVSIQPTMTIQGEAYTVRELLKKHTTGVLPDIAKNPIYFDTDDFESVDFSEIHNMDIAEKKLFISQNKEFIERLEAEVKESEKTADKVVSDQKPETPDTTKTE